MLACVATLVACGDDSGTGGEGASGGSGAQGGAGGEVASGGGGETAEGGAGGGPSDWESYCEARAGACAGFDASVCEAQETCAKDLLRDEIEQSLIDCLTTACAEEACFGGAMRTPLSDQGQSFLDACLAWVDACPSALDDICMDAYLVNDDTLASLEACTAEPVCADVDTCMDPILATFDACESWL